MPLHLKIRQQIYTFTFKPGFTLLWSAIFITCCFLGHWQLHRYTYKKNLLAHYTQSKIQAPIQLTEQTSILPFQMITATGHYLNTLTILVQNRFYHNQIGFEILTPLIMPATHKLLLVDRGWIPASQQHSILTATTLPQVVKGYAKFLDEYQFILGKNILQPTVQPLVVQKINLAELQQLTHQDFYPFVLRLDPSQPNGFVRDWVITNVPPERHLMYAIQWFVMACVIVIAFMCFCCERKKCEN